MTDPKVLFVSLVTGLLAQTVAAASIVVPAHANDGLVDVNGLAGSLADPLVRPGTGGNDSRGQAAIFFFALPTLGAPNDIVSSTLRLSYAGIEGATPDFNGDLFGLGTRPHAAIASTDYFDGAPARSTDTLLVDDLLTPTSSSGPIEISSASFTDYLRSLYEADGTPSAAYAVFRVNADIELPSGSPPIRGYLLATGDHADDSPSLTLSAVPEPVSLIAWSVLSGLLLAYGRRTRNPKVQSC
jgi:hypothetical protein